MTAGHAAASVRSAASASIELLTDDALISIFSHLDFMDRFRVLPLVSQRWRQLVNCPQLLSHADVSIKHGAFAERAESLCCWLEQRAAGRVQHLELDLQQVEEGGNEWDDGGVEPQVAALVEAEARRGLAPLGTVLCHPGHVRALRSLDLHLHLTVQVVLDNWVAGLRGLTCLKLNNSGSEGLKVAAPLDGLTALRVLELNHSYLPPATPLPPTLTLLCLCGVMGEELPNQVGSLTQLQHLIVTASDYSATSYACLTRLTSLRRLALWHCAAQPACLPQLSWLEGLQLAQAPPCQDCRQVERQLAAALTGLSQLTYLWFGNTEGSVEGGTQYSALPRELTALTKLRCFGWDAPAPASPALPAGRWLAGLQRAALPASVVAASLQQLEAATELCELAVTRFLNNVTDIYRGFRDPPDSSSGSHPWHWGVVRWATQHAPLRRLALLMASPQAAVASMTACLAAQRSNPALVIESDAELLGELSGELI